MDFSKDNIVSRHFSKKALGGLNEFEVRDFLHVLAEEIRHLEQLVFNQKKRLRDQDEQIRDYRDREHILKKSIASAQEIANKIRKDTETQGQLIIDHAHEKAESIIQEARLSLQSVYGDINDLKRLHLQFKTSLKASLQAHLEFLEQDSFMMSPLPRAQNSEKLEAGHQSPTEDSNENPSTNSNPLNSSSPAKIKREEDVPSFDSDSFKESPSPDSLGDSLRSLDSEL